MIGLTSDTLIDFVFSPHLRACHLEKTMEISCVEKHLTFISQQVNLIKYKAFTKDFKRFTKKQPS